MEGLERLEDFYVGTHLRDNIASLRDSTFTASDVDVDVGRNRWYSRPHDTIIVESHSCGKTSCLLTMSWGGWAYREGSRKTGCRLFLLAGLFRFNWVALQGAVMGASGLYYPISPSQLTLVAHGFYVQPQSKPTKRLGRFPARCQVMD